MGQILKAESIGAVSISGTTLTLAASILNVGGQQYETAALTLALTGLSASTKYNIFAVSVANVVSLVKDTAAAPSGYPAYRLVYVMNTDSASSIMSKDMWQTGKGYIAGDLAVREGYLIRCLVNHTAGTYATDVQSGNWQMASPMKNNIINGNFDIWQRGTSGFTSSVYGADRFISTAGVESYSQGSSSAPSGSNFYAQITRTTASSGSLALTHRIEQKTVKELAGKIVTLSGLVKQTSGTTNPFKATIYSASSPDIFGATQEIAETTILASPDSTWRKFYYTFTLPTNCSTNGLQFNIGNLTTTGPVTYQITQVMLNEGPAPALFQTAGANVQAELAMCQRYYQKNPRLWVEQLSTTEYYCIWQFITPFRSTPTISSLTTTPYTERVPYSVAAIGVGSAITNHFVDPVYFAFKINGFSGLVPYDFGYYDPLQIAADAEL